MLQRGSDISMRTSSTEYRQLHTLNPRPSPIQVLLQHDADISVRSCAQQQPDILLPCTGGSTPLHLAAARGSVEICKLLLKTHVGSGGGGGKWGSGNGSVNGRHRRAEELKGLYRIFHRSVRVCLGAI